MTDDDTPSSGAIKEKLIRSKQAWAREGRLLTGHSAPPAQRLPPGQRKVEDWPVLDLGVTPTVDPKKWKLVCDGLVQNPVTWDWDTFMAQQQVTIHQVAALASGPFGGAALASEPKRARAAGAPASTSTAARRLMNGRE